MSTAEHHLPFVHAPTPRRQARGATRLERLVLVLGVCLPVPVFAATGLSLPLPSAVERIAAALVPWAEIDTLSDRPVVRGSIVLAPNERPSGNESTPAEPASATRARPVQPVKRPKSKAKAAARRSVQTTSRAAGVAPPIERASTHPAQRNDHPVSTPAVSEQPRASTADPRPVGGTEPKPSPTDPAPTSEPRTDPTPTEPTLLPPSIQEPVDEVTAVVTPVVEEPVATGTKVVSDPIGTVGGVLGGNSGSNSGSGSGSGENRSGSNSGSG